MKREASSGEKKSGSQSVNNSLASFRHQRGRNSTDPMQMHVLTLVANSTLPYYMGRICLTVLRAGVAGMVLTRQRA